MLYESFAGFLNQYKTKEDMLSAFHALFEVDRDSLDKVNAILSRHYPDRFHTGLQALAEQTEQERRRTVSQTLRNNMLTAVERAYEQEQFKKDETVNRRGLMREEYVILDLSGSLEEYRRRGAILNGSDPQAKAELALQVIDSMEPLFRKFRETPLNGMTDEEIAENFGDINLLNQVCNQLLAMIGNPHISFSDQQRERLLGLDAEFSASLSGAFCRAKAICEPYYERFPSELLQGLDISEIPELTDQKFINYANKDVNYGELNFYSLSIRNQITQTALDGYAIDDVDWMDEKGGKIAQAYTSGQPDLPGLELLQSGKPLTAFLPNGATKVFRFSTKTRDYGLKTAGPETLPDFNPRVIDEGIQENLQGLVDGLREADHWYVRSSKEFKNLKSTLDKFQKEWQTLGPDPTPYQRGKLAEQMTELLGDSLLYLERKENGQQLSDTAQERVKAVKAVRDFAKFKLDQLRLMDQQDRAKINEAEADAFRQTEERRQAHQDTITQHMNDLLDFEGKPLPDAQTLVTSFQDYLDLTSLNFNDRDMRFRYINSNGTPQLVDDICNFYSPDSRSFPLDVQEQLRQSLAQMTAAGMVSYEKTLEGEKASTRLQDRFRENPEKLAKDVLEDPLFQKATKTITPKSLADLILKDELFKLSGPVGESMIEQQKELERKAKEEAERKAKEEAKRKAREEAKRKAAEKKAREEAQRKAEAPYQSVKDLGSVSTVSEQMMAYMKLKCTPSPWGNALDDMRKEVVQAMIKQNNEQLLLGEQELGLPEDVARRNMAKIVGINLILTERIALEGAPKDQSPRKDGEFSCLEEALNKVGIDAFAKSIENRPEFKEHTTCLSSGDTYRDFFQNNRTWDICKGMVGSAMKKKAEQAAQGKGLEKAGMAVGTGTVKKTDNGPKAKQ